MSLVITEDGMCEERATCHVPCPAALCKWLDVPSFSTCAGSAVRHLPAVVVTETIEWVP